MLDNLKRRLKYFFGTHSRGSVRNLAIGRSTAEDIIAWYGDMYEYEYIEHDTECEIKFASFGLSFYCHPSGRRKLKRITFTYPFNDRKTKTITIGQSTMKDVAEVFGPPVWRYHKYEDLVFSNYEEMGVEFYIRALLPDVIGFPTNKEHLLNSPIVEVRPYPPIIEKFLRKRRKSKRKRTSQHTEAQIDDGKLFKERFIDHIKKMSSVSKEFKQFANMYFSADTIATLAESAKEKMQLTQSDRSEHSVAIAVPPIFYQLNTLAMNLDEVREYFDSKYGGFLNLLSQSIESNLFKEFSCSILCLITYGRLEDAWVSMSIVPTANEAPNIKIMSVEFLNERERQNLSRIV